MFYIQFSIPLLQGNNVESIEKDSPNISRIWASAVFGISANLPMVIKSHLIVIWLSLSCLETINDNRMTMNDNNWLFRKANRKINGQSSKKNREVRQHSPKNNIPNGIYLFTKNIQIYEKKLWTAMPVL